LGLISYLDHFNMLSYQLLLSIAAFAAFLQIYLPQLHVSAQLDPNVGAYCYPGSPITTLKNCDELSSELAKCNLTTGTAKVACLCTQPLFNLITEYAFFPFPFTTVRDNMKR
jgi:hypothetical protein